MDGGKAWPFFCFQLNQPKVGSESEPENSYGSSQAIGVFLSCFCRTLSSLWRFVSLASSSVTFELACTNVSSAFQQQSHSAEAFSSPNLTLSVRLSWQLLYHSTFYLTQRTLCFLYGEKCSAMQFRMPFWPPLIVFLLLVLLMPLQCAKHMLCTYCIPHDALWW